MPKSVKAPHGAHTAAAGPRRRGTGRRTAVGIGVAFASFVAAVSVIEACLRLVPNVLPMRLQNAVYSRYDTTPTGMYFTDLPTKMNFLRPGYETTAFFNGYFWEHHADENGFRNPDAETAKDVLLLGDSFIYGHGVEE